MRAGWGCGALADKKCLLPDLRDVTLGKQYNGKQYKWQAIQMASNTTEAVFHKHCTFGKSGSALLYIQLHHFIQWLWCGRWIRQPGVLLHAIATAAAVAGGGAAVPGGGTAGGAEGAWSVAACGLPGGGMPRRSWKYSTTWLEG